MTCSSDSDQKASLDRNYDCRVLISGGPGAGCTSTAVAVGLELGLPVFDSDSFFHKPTDPPYQEANTPEVRRKLLQEELAKETAWIVSGSVATWDLIDFTPTHGVFLSVPACERLRRLQQRQQDQFASRIEAGGDMSEEHHAFLEWAMGYESRTGVSRNLAADRSFLQSRCRHVLEINEVQPLNVVTAKVIQFLSEVSE